MRVSLLGAVLGAVFPVAPLAAQRTHVNGLTGDLPPDTSNWVHPAAPDGNPFVRSTATPQQIAERDAIAQLGKVLFWEEQVSSDNTNSCGTCHAPRAGGTDDRHGAVHANGNFGAFGVIPQSLNGNVDYGFAAQPTPGIGRLVTPVSAPTMIGAYMFNQLFWDMRAGPDFKDENAVQIPTFDDWAALEDLSVGPPLSEVEMGHEQLLWSQNFIQDKLGNSYPFALVDPSTIPPDVQWIPALGIPYHKVFDIVFANHPTFGGGGGVTRERFACAVAHYQRTLIPDQAPIDLGTMTQQQIDGFDFIKNRADCFSCHSATRDPRLNGAGPLVDPFDNPFSDGQLHDIGLPGNVPRKTATLRNVGLHQKFFSTGHGGDGSSQVFVTTFDELIDFYQRQPGRFGFPPMTQSERDAVKDFLQNALTDPRVAAETFPFDRPQLYSEAHPFEANEYGVGTPSPGGFFTPEIIANSPPLVTHNGAPMWFKIGVGEAPPNAPAVLMIGAAPDVGPVIWVTSAVALIPAPNTTAEGISTAHMPVPLSVPLLGIPFYAQWMIRDRYGRAFSNAAEFVPFQW